MTTTISKRILSDRYPAIQFDAETRTIEREVIQAWPAIVNVFDVLVTRSPADANAVVIYVTDADTGESHKRVRQLPDALAEIVGFAAQAKAWRVEDTAPAVVREYMAEVTA